MSRDVLVEHGGMVNLIIIVFSIYLLGIPSAVKIILGAINRVVFGYYQFKAFNLMRFPVLHFLQDCPDFRIKIVN